MVLEELPIVLSNGNTLTLVYSGPPHHTLGRQPRIEFWIDTHKLDAQVGRVHVGTLSPFGFVLNPFPEAKRFVSFCDGLSDEDTVVKFYGVPVEVKVFGTIYDVNICIDGVFIFSLSKFETRDDLVVVPWAADPSLAERISAAIFEKIRKNAEQAPAFKSAQVPSVTAQIKEQDDLLEEKKRTINELEEQLMTAERALDKEKKTSEQLRKKNDGLLSALTALEQRVTTLEERLAHASGTNDVLIDTIKTLAEKIPNPA